MNERIYKEKIELIEKAAETYASNTPDVFNAEFYQIVQEYIISALHYLFQKWKRKEKFPYFIS